MSDAAIRKITKRTQRKIAPAQLSSARRRDLPQSAIISGTGGLAEPMPLTDAQIDRYSRQIIVPRVGGRAQERILAARIVFAAESPELEPALAYLAGAGVGRIELEGPRASRVDQLCAAMRSLNPDCTVAAYDARQSSHGAPGLVFAIIGGAASQSPPCAVCSADLLAAPFGARSDAAAVIAMAATAEVFKLLAGYDPAPRAALLEFDGYQSRTYEPAINSNCACASKSA
jgi:hypothetical protein